MSLPNGDLARVAEALERDEREAETGPSNEWWERWHD